MTQPNPVQPVEETPEMRSIRDFFTSVANRMVEATTMAQDFHAMRGDFDALRSDMDQLRNRNRELDQSVADIRVQRDAAQSEATELKGLLLAANDAKEVALGRIRELNSALEERNVLVASLKRERDDYGLKAMEQEERANRLEAQLKVITDAMAKVAEVTGQPKPSFLREVSGEVLVPTSPTPSTQSNPVPEMKRVYRGDPEWNKDYPNTHQMNWDNEAVEWYVEVPVT